MKPSQYSAGALFAIRVVLVGCLALTSAHALIGQDAALSNDPKKLIRQASKLLRAGSINKAEEILRHSVKHDPTSASKLELAFTLSKKRNILEASQLSFDVAKAEPANARAFSVLGTVLLNAGRFDESRALLINALKLDKKDHLAWAGIGLLDFYENRIIESLNNLREAEYHNPDEPDYVFAIAQVASRGERYREAADAYYRFLTISKDKDDERRARIRGLINFLRFLGQKNKLYDSIGRDRTNIEFSLIGNRPVVEVKINGRGEKLRFVLDTGSGITVLSKKTAKRLDVDSITKGGFARGIGGTGKFEIIYGFLNQVDIGEAVVRNVPVYIRELHDLGYQLDGYIGLSLISKFLTTIDYGEKTFSLTRNESDEAAFRENPDLSLPLRLTSSGFLSGEVQLEGIESPLNFIVDTGASVSVISDRVAGVEAIKRYLSPDRLRVIGSAGVTDNVPTFMLPKVSFGSHSRSSISAIALDLDIINESSGFEQAGILGGNFLKNYRLTFDFKNSKVTFVLVNTEHE